MEDCIFCKIIKGQVPSTILYEDDKIIAFKDISPAAPIHFLVIPKQHIPSLVDIPEGKEEIIVDIYAGINKIARQQGMDKKGFRVIVNCGEDGCQEVPHLHFHVLGGKKLGEKIVK